MGSWEEYQRNMESERIQRYLRAFITGSVMIFFVAMLFSDKSPTKKYSAKKG
jgi:hypothetical protein